jgi:hypothetical protein
MTAREVQCGNFRVRRTHPRPSAQEVATTAAICSHAIRGKDRAAAEVWDDLMQQSRGEKPAGKFL